MEVSASFWIGFIILVVALLSLDMFVFNKKGTVEWIKNYTPPLSSWRYSS